MEITFPNDKIVLVTGSTRGIGKAIALKFAKAGAQVAIHYRKNPDLARNVMESLPGSGHFMVKGDLSSPIEIKLMFENIINLKNRIDILVNNAGIYEEKEWWKLDYEEWQRHWNTTINSNLNGFANLSFLVARQMIEQGGGKIINISSRGAFRGEPNALPYGAAKAGMNSFGQSMAWALAPKNVYVYTIAPGFVRTDMTEDILNSERGKAITAQSPMNRVAEPEEIAQAALMMAADGSEYMSGCILDVNGASYLRS
jgi:3-oxoacyl-[acyl-carrier protein] reductase